LVKPKNLSYYLQPLTVRKEFVEEEPPHKGSQRRALVILFDLPARHLHQLSVLHA
jgi:hypothetical protein